MVWHLDGKAGKEAELMPRVERTMSEISIDELLMPVVAETPEARAQAYVEAWHRKWLKTSVAMKSAGAGRFAPEYNRLVADQNPTIRGWYGLFANSPSSGICQSP